MKMSTLPIKKRKKVAHDLNKGPLQTITSYKLAFAPRRGKSANLIKNRDNLTSGSKFYQDTTYRNHFGEKRKTKVKNNFLQTSALFHFVKNNHRGHALRANMFHPSGQKRSVSSRSIPIQPAKYAKDRWYGDGQRLNNGNAYQEHYPGHYGGFAKKNRERFDNLGSYPKLPMSGITTKKRFFTPRKVDTSVDRGLRKMMRDFDRTTETMKNCLRDRKIAETKSQFNERNGEINSKIHTGRDNVAKHELEQLMGGFYYDPN